MEKARAVIDSGDADLQQKVENDELTLNKASAQVRNKKKSEKPGAVEKAMKKQVTKAHKQLEKIANELDEFGTDYSEIAARLREACEELAAKIQ